MGRHKAPKSKQNRNQRKQKPSGGKLNSATVSCPKAKGTLLVVIKWAREKTTAKLPSMSVSVVSSNGSLTGMTSYSGGLWGSPELPILSHEVTIAFPQASDYVIVGSDRQNATPSRGGEIVIFKLEEKPKLKVKFVLKPDPLKGEEEKLFQDLPIHVTSSMGPSLDSSKGIADFKTVEAGTHVLTAIFKDITQNKFDFVNPAENDPRDDCDPGEDLTRTQAQVELNPGDDKTVVIQVEPLYTKVVFVGHCLLTIAKQIYTGGEWNSEYNGLTPETSDIAKRVALLQSVANTAYGNVSDDPHELKVFVVPECFFLGRNGAYSIQALSELIEALQTLAKEAKWRHWMFAFGTVNSTSQVDGDRFELYNFAPVIRGGFQSKGLAPKYTKLIQKTFYSAEMPEQGELIVPGGEQPFYGELFNKKFSATQNEYTLGRLLRELLGLTWDGEGKTWIDSPEPEISGQAVNAFCLGKGWKDGDWANLKAAASRDVKDRGLTLVARELRDKPPEDRLRILVRWYADSQGGVSGDMFEQQKGEFFDPQDFTFCCARKPGPLLVPNNKLSRNRKINFGLEICADHSKGRVRNSRSSAERDLDLRLIPAQTTLRKLNNDKKALEKRERDLPGELNSLEEIVLLLNSGPNAEATRKIKELFQADEDPATMKGLLEDRKKELRELQARKPELEKEIIATKSEVDRMDREKAASTREKELDIQLIPSAGMTLLPLNLAVRSGGYAFNCDGWNASGAQLTQMTNRGGNEQNILTIKKDLWPIDAGHNPLTPHTELIKAPMNNASRRLAPTSHAALADDVNGIFAEGPGQLHIYPPQDLPN